MINKKKSDALYKQLNINDKVIDKKKWNEALNIELEHEDITKGDLMLTLRIVLAHLSEFPNYYDYLIDMEKKLNKYWANKEKPNIFND